MNYDALQCEEHKGYSFKGHILQNESSSHLLSNISSAKFCSMNYGFDLITIKTCV
jgi:hypothetical protein